MNRCTESGCPIHSPGKGTEPVSRNEFLDCTIGVRGLFYDVERERFANACLENGPLREVEWTSSLRMSAVHPKAVVKRQGR